MNKGGQGIFNAERGNREGFEILSNNLACPDSNKSDVGDPVTMTPQKRGKKRSNRSRGKFAS
jgi:hypothetical protein